MILRALLIAAALAVPLPASAAPAREGAKAVVANAIERFIRPGYARFHEDASDLGKAVGGLCRAPSAEALAAARSAFAQAVRSWSTIEIVRFGPVTQKNRLERILFWPDPKGIGLRQVQAILGTEDETATDAATLRGKSVAVQGLAALEFVLHGTGSGDLEDAAGSFRCRYGLSISANLEQLSAEVDDAWADPEGIAYQWTHPAADNRLYRDENEMLGGLVDQLVHGLDLVRDVRLGGFLGTTPDEDRPRQALFRRSGLTLTSMAANMEGMEKLFETSGIGVLLDQDDNWIPESVAFEFGNAQKTLAAMTLPVEEAVKDPGQRKALDHMNLVLDSLTNLIAGKLGRALGLTTGFSSLDGD